MYRYIVSNQRREDGAHEVHQANSSCGQMPPAFTLRELGNHASFEDAVGHASRQWPTMQIVGCVACIELDQQDPSRERLSPTWGMT